MSAHIECLYSICLLLLPNGPVGAKQKGAYCSLRSHGFGEDRDFRAWACVTNDPKSTGWQGYYTDQGSLRYDTQCN